MFSFICFKYHRALQMKLLAERILRKHINLKFYDHFNSNFIIENYGLKRAKKIYDAIDILSNIDHRRKLHLIS